MQRTDNLYECKLFRNIDYNNRDFRNFLKGLILKLDTNERNNFESNIQLWRYVIKFNRN